MVRECRPDTEHAYISAATWTNAGYTLTKRFPYQTEEACSHSAIGGQDRIRAGEYLARLPASASGMRGLRPSRRKQFGADCIKHNIHPRSPIGNAGCSRIMLCEAARWKSPPYYRKNSELVSEGTTGNLHCGRATSAVSGVPRVIARAMDSDARIAEILRQQGFIWLAVRPDPDYRLRRAAPEVERGVPSITYLAYEKAYRRTGFLEKIHMQRDEHQGSRTCLLPRCASRGRS